MAQINLGHVVGPGVPTGGTAGQILKKNSATNFDDSWGDLNAGTIPMSGADNTSIATKVSTVEQGLGTAAEEITAEAAARAAADTTIAAGISLLNDCLNSIGLANVNGTIYISPRTSI